MKHSTAAVALRAIDKRFGAVHANRAVDLTVMPGTVHGIVGENGAGKSTLMSILYGFYQADSGSIEIDGRPARIASSRDAIALGIGMVHQHFMLVDNLTALDNIMLGAEPTWRLADARAQVRATLEPLMRESGLDVRLDAPVADLPVGERQRLEILKTLVRGARILILDEPTAVLTPQETEALFVTLRRLRERGTTILLITHKLKEILALCDAVTVMRGGAVVLDASIDDVTLDSLAEAMVGRRVRLDRGAAVHSPATTPDRPVLLQAQGLSWRDGLGVVRLDAVSVRLSAGEIVGIAGVSGNGQSELLDALAGLLEPDAGTLTVGGASFAPGRWIDPVRARDLRIAHVPEDRHKRGLVLPFPAWESAVLGYEREPCYSERGFMKGGSIRHDTVAMMERYDVRPRDPKLRSSKFSGGNQQKLVLAREARPEPRVLLVGQPTRGVDIGAIEFIHGSLRAMRDAGGAVLLVSSELDEILALADRVIVMNAGRVAGELPIEQCDEATLGRMMGGGALNKTIAACLWAMGVGLAAAQTPDAVELEFWRSADRLGTAQSYEAYLQRYPSGAFTPLAQAAIAKLRPLSAAPRSQLTDYRAEAHSAAVGVGVGETFTGPGVITVGWLGAKKQLLIPNGEWVLIAGVDHDSRHASPAPMTSLAFAQVHDRAAVSLLVASFTRRPGRSTHTWTDVTRCEADTESKLWHEVPSRFPRATCMHVATMRGASPEPYLAGELWQSIQANAGKLGLDAAALVYGLRSTLFVADHYGSYLQVRRFDADARAKNVEARLAWAKEYLPIAAQGFRRDIEAPELTAGGADRPGLTLRD